MWSSWRLRVLVGFLALVTFAMCLALLASRGYALFLIAVFLLCGLAVWAGPRRAAVPGVMLGVLLIPTNAFPSDRIHGIPVFAPLAFATLCAALALWWYMRATGVGPSLSAYSLASLLLVIVSFIAQLGISQYASLVPLYQLLPFWISGLLLGSILATDSRIADSIGLVVLPLALLAIVESAIVKPTLYSDLIRANNFDYVSGEDRVASTFGHPLTAGTALIILAFLVLSKPGPRSAILFSLITAGAIVTVSRSALVGLAAGTLTYLVGSHRQRSHIVGAIAVTALIGWLLLSLVPAFHTSFDSRVLHVDAQSEKIRLNSLQEVRAALSQNKQEVWLGRGLEGSNNYLYQTRTAQYGFGNYDNEYVTALFDSGLPVLLAVVGLIVLGVIRARPGARRLAPLVVAAAAMFFFSGLYWPVTALLFWMAVGLATAPLASRASGVP
jgi:hypothetical protein